MHNRNTTSTGFTIVELLIVIVVIAILATISIVAFTGIQDRANDSAVQHDLSNFAKKVQIAMAETGSYPVGGHTISTEGSSGSGQRHASPTPTIDFRASKTSYVEFSSPGSANFVYCSGPHIATGASAWAVVARAKSSSAFRYSSPSGLEKLSSTAGSMNHLHCAGSEIGYPMSYSYGYSVSEGGWQPWVE